MPLQAYNLAGPVHVAVDAAVDRARPAQPPRTISATSTEHASVAATALSLAVLLFAVSLAQIDGLLSNVVAYERDTTVFYFPLMRWAAQQLHEGIFPLWTPQVFGGYPIFADGEIGLAYPPALLAMLVLPVERAFVLLRVAHLWLAAVGMYALARAWQLPRPAAVLAGCVFALGNFLQAQVHHENIIRTAAWLPVVLACAEIALRAEGARRVRWTVAGGLALAMAGLGLHSQMLAIDLLVLAAYGALRWWVGCLGGLADGAAVWQRFRVVARVCAPMVLLGLGVAAVQLLPLIELAGFSPRGSGFAYSDSAAYSLTPFGLPQLVFPFLFRGPGNVPWGLWTHWESYLYVGLAPLVLATIALCCVRRREVAGWGILGGLGVVLALGQYSPLNLHYLLWLLPGLNGLRAPGRFTIVVVLAAAMLAAFGLTWLLREASRCAVRRVVRWLALGLAVMTLLLVSAHGLLLALPGPAQTVIQAVYLIMPRDSYPLTASDVWAGLMWSTDPTNPRVLGALLGLAGVLGVIWLWRGSAPGAHSTWRGWPALLVAVTALDLLIFSWGIHPRAPLALLGVEPPAVDAIERAAAAGPEPVRILSSPVLNQVAADRLAPFGVQDAGGYSSLQFAWHRDYLGRVLQVDDDLLDLWNVRYVVDPARYGVLSNYRGIDFLPGQSVLQGVAGSAVGEERLALTPGRELREVRLVTALIGAVDIPQDTPVADVELRNAAGEVVARTSLLAGRDTMEWAWDLPSVRPYVRHARAEVAGSNFERGNGNNPDQRLLSFSSWPLEAPVDAASLEIRTTLPRGELVVYGGGTVASDGSIEQLFGRTKAKFRPVYTDGQVRVLENTEALPRAFVVSRARWSPSLGAALGEMVRRPFQPREEVVLAADSTTPVTVQPDATGSASIEHYAANEVRVRASSTGDALLVLSDTYYPGWKAFVDGREQPLLRGDLLFRVVPLPAGDHVVELRFEPTSVRLGLLISGLALLIGIAALVAAGRMRNPGRTTE